MPQIPNNVNPGDLITASLFDSMLAVLADHETRIAKLEGQVTTGSGVAITEVNPSSVHPGDQVQLIGSNFGVTTLNNITISGVQVTAFDTAHSNNTLLTFTVPAIVGIPSGGMAATINLSNPSGSASTTVLLQPSQPSIPTGTIQVAESQVSQTTPVTSPEDIILTYMVSGTTSQQETYNVTATVDAGWAAVLVDSSHNAIVPSQITMPQGIPPTGVNTAFLIKVSVPNGLGAGAIGNVNVSVASVLNPLGLKTPPVPAYALTVGSPPPGAQNNVIIQLTDVLLPGTQSGNAIKVPATGALVTADFQVTFLNPDTYVITTPPTFANATGWSGTVFGGPQFTTTAPGAHENFQVVLTVAAASGAVATTMTITITSKTNPAITGQLQQAVQPA